MAARPAGSLVWKKVELTAIIAGASAAALVLGALTDRGLLVAVGAAGMLSAPYISLLIVSRRGTG